jgi:hypothetical protein
VSLHSENGSRQLGLAENMNFYAPPGQPNPIDEARGRFYAEALCGNGNGNGDGSAATAAGDATWLLRLPSDLSIQW